MQLSRERNICSALARGNAPAHPVTSRLPEFAWYVISLLLIAAFGALKVALPLHRDGATFLWLASQLDRGAVLYTDVWDVKQPGIFIFDHLAGRMFGFSAEGVHLFELLWQSTFAVIVMIALRPALERRWLAVVAPVAFLAGYYIFCEAHQQTQLEILVGLPLFIAAWCTSASWRSRRQRTLGFLVAGIAAGVATGFKHVLAPIPVAFLVAASSEMLRRGGDRRASTLVLHMWLPFAFGVMLVWGTLGIAFWRLGALDAFLSTTFLYPLGALSDIEAAPFSRLVISFAIFTAAMAPWLLYAALSVPRLASSDEPAIFGRMGVWLATAILVILLQKSSWWTFTPAFPTMTLSLVLVVPVLAALAYPAGETARRLYTSISEHGDLEKYRRTVSPDYGNAADAVAFLDLNAPPGSIYVFGDPTIHLLSGRSQAIPLQGSGWDFYLPRQWQQLSNDLAATRPVWIFLESVNSVARNSPATIALLARETLTRAPGSADTSAAMSKALMRRLGSNLAIVPSVHLRSGSISLFLGLCTSIWDGYSSRYLHQANLLRWVFSPDISVRPDSAYHQWREVPPRQLSV